MKLYKRMAIVVCLAMGCSMMSACKDKNDSKETADGGRFVITI